MGLIKVNIIDKGFKKSLCNEYRLSLTLGINGIAYMLVDGTGQIVLYREYDLKATKNTQEELQKIFKLDEYLSLQFRNVKLMLYSDSFTLLPERLYKEEDKALYLKQTTLISNSDYYSDDRITFNNARLIFALENDIVSVLKTQFPTAKMHHKISSLIYGWKKYADANKGKQVYIHVNQSSFVLGFYDDGQLIFINRFDYKTAGDFLYYTLLIYDRFELQALEVPCCLSGKIEKESELYKTLYKYIKNISFIPDTPYYKFSKAFQPLQKHYHFDLFSLKLCE